MANPNETVTLNVVFGKKELNMSCPRETILSVLRQHFKINDKIHDILLEQLDAETKKWFEVNALSLTDEGVIKLSLIDVQPGPSHVSNKRKVPSSIDGRQLSDKISNDENLTKEESSLLVKLLLGRLKNGKSKTCNVQIQTDKEHTLDCTDTQMWLKNVSKRNSQDKQRIANEINTGMESTYRRRRQFILSECPSVMTMLDLYPVLFNFDQVISEFHRIADKDVTEIFSQKLEKHASYIIRQVPVSVTPVKLTMQKLKNAGNDEENIKHVGALLSLPYFLGENLSEIIHFDTKDVSGIDRPIIITESKMSTCFTKECQFQIYVENLKLCETKGFAKAVLALLAAYYIFSIVYPPSCCQTLTVIQTVFMLIPADDIEKGLTSTVKKIQKLMS